VHGRFFSCPTGEKAEQFGKQSYRKDRQARKGKKKQRIDGKQEEAPLLLLWLFAPLMLFFAHFASFAVK